MRRKCSAERVAARKSTAFLSTGKLDGVFQSRALGRVSTSGADANTSGANVTKQLQSKRADSSTLGALNQLKAALSEREAATYIGLTVWYLQRDRNSKEKGDTDGRTPGPPYVRVGRRIRYLIKDLDEWLLNHRVARGNEH